MTREETLKLLKILRAAYPTAKIPDAEGLVMAWELAFGDMPADVVYKAARVHMDNSTFFPSIHDIKKNYSRGQLVYDGNMREGRQALPSTPKISSQAPKVKLSVACKGSSICPYFESELCFGNKEEMELCCL